MKTKRITAAFLAAVLAAGAMTIPAAAQIDLDRLPEPISSDSKAVKAFSEKKPVVSKTSDNSSYYASYMSFKWTPVDNALLYYVYVKNESDKGFSLAAKTFDTEYSGSYTENCEYKVCAVTYTYNDTEVKSAFSNVLKFSYKPKTRPKRSYGGEVVSGEGIEGEGDVIEDGIYYAASNSAASPSEYYTPNTEEYSHSEESGFKNAATDPLSTFSADVDTASYANLRRIINEGSYIPEDAVRVEEMLNYFDYGYPAPEKNSKAPFSVYTELSDCPWNDKAKLMMIGIQGKELSAEEQPDSNLVFLLDVSGSMSSKDKLPLAISSIEKLTETMGENDRLSIVTYSGEERVILAGAHGNQKKTVGTLTSLLEAYGATNGESGINAAYAIAEKYFIEGGNNRVILATDGDLNVGISDVDELTELISEKRESGVYLTVLGFGKGNIKDNKMEALADNGNGSYHYIDSIAEAEKVLKEERDSTLFTIAKDVKLQVEFNPTQVGKYRLIGYDNRRLENEDFENDAKDAGDVGAGHRVTALYEIIPSDGSSNSALKYRQNSSAADSGEWASIKVRYKDPDTDKAYSITHTVGSDAYSSKMTDRMKFACAVTELGLVLGDSEVSGMASTDHVLAELSGMKLDDPYKKEFRNLVEMLIASEYRDFVSGKLPTIFNEVTLTHYGSKGKNEPAKKLTASEIVEWKKKLGSCWVCPAYFTDSDPADGYSEAWIYNINTRSKVGIYCVSDEYYMTFNSRDWYKIVFYIE